MKIKVKGLVFVGFAAAIMSASAVADPSGTTITSLAYTDATYQQKTAASHSGEILYMQSNNAGDIGYKGVLTDESMANVNTGTAGAGTNDTKIPTARAVKGYVDDAITNAYDDFTGTDGTDNGVHGLVPAPTTDDADKVLGSSGDWIGAFGAATAGAAGSTGLVPAPEAGDQNKVLTGGGNWIGSFGGATNDAAGTTGLVPAPTTAQKEMFLKGDGSWGTPTDNDTTYNVMGAADASDAGTSGLVPQPVAGDNTKFLRGDATWAPIPAASIPGKSSLCTASLPCALVAETSGFHWRVMAVSANQVPAAGTLADYCTANTDCPTGATCNTTGGANVCVESN